MGSWGGHDLKRLLVALGVIFIRVNKALGSMLVSVSAPNSEPGWTPCYGFHSCSRNFAFRTLSGLCRGPPGTETLILLSLPVYVTILCTKNTAVISSRRLKFLPELMAPRRSWKPEIKLFEKGCAFSQPIMNLHGGYSRRMLFSWI